MVAAQAEVRQLSGALEQQQEAARRMANAAVIDHNSNKIGDWHAANGKLDPSTIMIDPSRA
mgnify:CR=1 FL=1